MLLIECPACGRRELRGVRSIERMEHTARGIVVTVTCTSCGYHCRIGDGAATDVRRPLPAAS